MSNKRLKDGYYKLQDYILPNGSKRRKLVQFIYRFPRNLTIKNIKKALKYIKQNGFRGLLRKIYVFLVHTPKPCGEHLAYLSWIKNNEPTKAELEEQINHKFNINPKISIIVPMYNTPEKFFVELVDSLKEQTYSNWELCLGDGSKIKAGYIDDILKSDQRIKYKFLNKNDGISENSNRALELATGDYIGLLDHDDTLPKFSLFEVVKTINENPEAEFIYTDEDKFHYDESDRYDPHFKPDFSPDTLRSYNYICHFSIFRRDLMDKLKGFRRAYDGSQDYDLILRATEQAKSIVHIPKILYHWRVHPNSTASSAQAKLWAYEAAVKAISSQLERLGIKGTVENEFSLGLYRVKYDIIGNPKISIIIPNKDSLADLKKCINSIKKSSYTNYEIIVVENNSETKEIFDYYKKLEEENKNIKVVKYEEKGFNYSKINNFGEKNATGEYILLLNNDTQVINKDWMEEMLSLCQRDDVGIVGAKLLYPDDTVQHAGVVIGIGGIAGHINKLIDDDDIGYYSRASIINNYSAVTAACFLVKKKIYEEVGGLTEEFKVAFNDIDFCLKVRKLNKLVVYTPYARLYHYESKSRGLEDTVEKQIRFKGEIDLFRSKWNAELEKGDPYFNKNLRLDTCIYQINPENINKSTYNQ